MPTELKYTPLSEVKSVSYSLENAYPDTTTSDQRPVPRSRSYQPFA